jgi:hypothetical protein
MRHPDAARSKTEHILSERQIAELNGTVLRNFEKQTLLKEYIEMGPQLFLWHPPLICG